jgi:hypothetical protein
MPDATRALSTDEVRARGDSIRACVLASLAVRAKPAAATRDGELHFLVIEAGRAEPGRRRDRPRPRPAFEGHFPRTGRSSIATASTRATRASGRRVDHHTSRARARILAPSPSWTCSRSTRQQRPRRRRRRRRGDDVRLQIGERGPRTSSSRGRR